jgi:hypothetical protein
MNVGEVFIALEFEISGVEGFVSQGLCLGLAGLI